MKIPQKTYKGQVNPMNHKKCTAFAKPDNLNIDILKCKPVNKMQRVKKKNSDYLIVNKTCRNANFSAYSSVN